MYTSVLFIHSLVRWAVLLTGLIAVFRGLTGWRSGRPWTLADERAGMWFTGSLDLQMLLGVGMYFFLSPITTAALHDFGGAMANAGLRFWAIEHPVGMILAIVFAHAGRARTRKIPHDARRHKIVAIFFTVAILLVLASIPWPGSPQGRPLLRW
jgi:hypothetical protein